MRRHNTIGLNLCRDEKRTLKLPYAAMKSGLKAMPSPFDCVSTYAAMKSGLKVATFDSTKSQMPR